MPHGAQPLPVCLAPGRVCACGCVSDHMADIEPLKPSNTGWLIADVVADTAAFGWPRTEVDPALLALEKSVKYAGWESGGQKASKDGMHSTKLEY